MSAIEIVISQNSFLSSAYASVNNGIAGIMSFGATVLVGKAKSGFVYLICQQNITKVVCERSVL
jgi:hypothetical protein